MTSVRQLYQNPVNQYSLQQEIRGNIEHEKLYIRASYRNATVEVLCKLRIIENSGIKVWNKKVETIVKKKMMLI